MDFFVNRTLVFERPDFNTGIQRVVSNIVDNLSRTADVVTAVPVIIRNNKLYEAKRLYSLHLASI